MTLPSTVSPPPATVPLQISWLRPCSTTKGSKRDSLTEALTSAATAVAGILTHKDCAESTTGKMSPAKRAQVSGQYLDHLEKLKQLQESGVLTVEEFEEQKTITLRNILQLNC